MTRLMQANETKKQTMVDLMVALISVPLLIVFGLMLQSNMKGDWTQDSDTRWRILGLGLSLLFVSLLMCLYVTHRLGLCIWAAQQGNEMHPNMRRASQRNTPHPLTSTGSQMQLVVSGELPPSYDSVVCSDLPPPYYSIIICNEKDGPPEKPTNERSFTHSVPGQMTPSTNG